MTKYIDPPSVGIGARPQISKCIRSKGAEENESLLLKGNFVFSQNDRKYNQIFETELNLNEKLTIKDEIRMDDQDEHAID